MAPRILLVHPGPDFSVADVFNGWKYGLERQGAVVATYNTNDRLSFYAQAQLRDWDYQRPCPTCDQFRVKTALDNEQAMLLTMQGLSHAVWTFMPDVMIFVSAFYTTAGMFELMRLRGRKVVLIHTESPYQDGEQYLRGQFADLNLVNDPMNLAEWRTLEAPAYYVPHAYHPLVHYPQPAGEAHEDPSDFAFVGTAFPSRIKFLERMDFTGMDVALGGSAWDTMDSESPLRKFLSHDPDHCVENAETARVYRGSRAGINLYRREGESHNNYDGWAMGPREVEMAACGLPFLRDPRAESDETFPFLPTFTTPDDATEKLRWLLADEDRRVGLGNQAREAIADRNFDAHGQWLMNEMDNLGFF